MTIFFRQVVDKALESLIWDPTPNATRQKNVLLFGFRKVQRSFPNLQIILQPTFDGQEGKTTRKDVSGIL
jgi:hypothetical protein